MQYYNINIYYCVSKATIEIWVNDFRFDYLDDLRKKAKIKQL